MAHSQILPGFSLLSSYLLSNWLNKKSGGVWTAHLSFKKKNQQCEWKRQYNLASTNSEKGSSF